MRNALIVLLMLGLFFFAIPTVIFASAPEGYQPDQLTYAPDRLLVKFSDQAFHSAEFNIDNTRATVPTTGLASFDAISSRVGVTSVHRAFIQVQNIEMDQELGVSRWHMVHVPRTTDIDALAAEYARDPNVESAHPDYRAYPMVVPNDPMYSSQWGHNNTGQMLDYCWGCGGHDSGSPVGTPGFDADAETAWNGSQGYGDTGTVIAILDSGVDIDHPDLRLVSGYDYGDNDSNPDDNSASPGHGTACAGVAAAISDNGIGVAGVAGGASVMPLKVADNNGSMYFSYIDNAIYHAADNGADVISMSLGAATSSVTSTDNALQYAYNAGVTILAATGNENQSTISYPAINQYVIGVGAASPCGDRKRSSSNSSEVNSGIATDPNGYTCDGERWWGSNYGVSTPDAAGAVDIIAPTILPTTDIGGSGGYNTSGGSAGDYYMWFNGTSCATPYAAGVAALVISQNPSWTPAQVKQQLTGTATDVVNVESGAGWDRYSGYGMVDAGAAVGGGGSSNTPPTADANGPYSGTAGVGISFSSAGSSDSDGTISSYLWNFGDGNTSTAANPTHTYATAGTYTVTLTVTDNDGASGNDNTTATVSSAPVSYASLPYSTGFESGLDTYWSTESSSSYGRIQVTTANTPHSGSYHLTMDVTTNGNYATNQADLHVNLSGQSQVDLEFWWKEFNDETNTQDGVYFSDNGGSSFVKVQDLSGGSTTWQQFLLDVDQLAGANGLSLSSTFVIRFQQYDNYAISTDGFAFDDVSVSGSTAPPNTPPTAEANGPYSGTQGTAIAFSSAGSSDSDGTISSYLWDFGDGSTSTAANPSHTYATAGTYTATLTVTDDDGDTGSDTATVTVSAAPSGNYATLPYSTGFESSDNFWTAQSSNSFGRIQATSANGPHSGSYHLTMDVTTNGNYCTNEAWLHLDLSGESQVDLSFWWKEFSDESHTQDGVYFSDNDGSSFVKVYDLTGGSSTWQQIDLDVDQLASSNGLSLSGTFIVKFQQYDNYAITTDGFAFDDVSVTAGSGGGGPTYITSETESNGSAASANGPVGDAVDVSGALSSSSDDDWFYFDVNTTNTINISVAIGSSADLDWYLYHESDTSNWVARGYTVSNPEAGSYNPGQTGRYYVRVDGYLGATSSYTLTVNGAGVMYADVSGMGKDVPFALGQNYPNPFNPSTTIRYQLPASVNVSLKVYNAAGQLVRTLVDDTQKPGVHDVRWDGRNDAGGAVASGTYFYQIVAGDRTDMKRMLLLK